MTTVLNRESIQVKRDLQRRVENWVAEYCDALEENFKQYSIDSYKRNLENPTKLTEGYKSYYQEQLEKIENERKTKLALEKQKKEQEELEAKGRYDEAIAKQAQQYREAEEAKKSDFDYDTYNGGVEYFGKK